MDMKRGRPSAWGVGRALMPDCIAGEKQMRKGPDSSLTHLFVCGHEPLKDDPSCAFDILP